VARWSELFQSVAGLDLAGDLALNVRIDKSLLANAAPANVQGYLRVSDGMVKIRRSGHTVDKLKTTVIFNGQQAKFVDLTFRTGASSLAIDGVIADIFQPSATYQLRSASLNVADLPTLNFGKALV
jgi:hypothetical protein